MKNLLKHKEILLLIIILVLSAFLRLYKISDYMTFLGDEGRDSLAVKGILDGHFTLLGPRSSAADFYYGPIYFYAIAPFLWLFNYDPVGPAVFVAINGIATVFLVYFFGKKFIDAKTGLFAAALYAVSPLVISYSRSSWNPNPLPFVTLLMLYFLRKAVKNKSFKLFLAVGILFGIAIQLQYIVVFVAVAIAFYTALAQRLDEKLKITLLLKQYAVMFVGFLIGWSPFLAFEIKHSFPNIKTIVNFILNPTTGKIYQEHHSFLETVANVFFRLFARLLTNFPPPEQFAMYDKNTLLFWQTGVLILAVFSIVFLFKWKNKFSVLLFSLWLFFGVALFGFYLKPIYDYYFGFMFTLPFFLVGGLLSQLYDSKRFSLLGKGVSLILFSFLFLFNLNANPFRYAPNRQKDQVKQIAEFVLSQTDDKPFNFALLTLGNSDHAYRYYFEIEHKSPITIENKDIDPQRKSVTGQLLVVCEDPNCKPLGAPLWEVSGFGRAEIKGHFKVAVVDVYKLVHYQKK